MVRHFKRPQAKRQNAMGCGGDDGGYFDMDNQRILGQKKGGGFIGSGLDHILQSHQAKYFGIILGMILNSELVQSRNAWTLRIPSPCKSPLGTLHP